MNFISLILLILATANAQLVCTTPSICDNCLCEGNIITECPAIVLAGSYFYRYELCYNCSISYQFNANDHETRVYVMNINELNNYISSDPFQYYGDASYGGQDYFCGQEYLWSIQNPPGGGLAIVFLCANEWYNCVFDYEYTIRNDCAPGCPDFWIDDTFCDIACYNAECDYDVGDCPCSQMPCSYETIYPICKDLVGCAKSQCYADNMGNCAQWCPWYEANKNACGEVIEHVFANCSTNYSPAMASCMDPVYTSFSTMVSTTTPETSYSTMISTTTPETSYSTSTTQVPTSVIVSIAETVLSTGIASSAVNSQAENQNNSGFALKLSVILAVLIMIVV